MIKKQQITCNV